MKPFQVRNNETRQSMRQTAAGRRSTIASFLLSLVLASAFSSAGFADSRNDLLQLPAAKSIHAAKGLLLDITPAGSRLVAVGEQGRIVYSDDAGSTWAQAGVPVRVTLTAVCFATPKVGWAVGHDGVILKSTDGGSTWEKQIDGARINQAAYDQVKSQAAAAADPGSPSHSALQDLNIYVKNLELIAAEGPTWPFLDVWFADEAEGYAVGAFGMVVRTTDGGSTWSPFLDRLSNPKGLHYYGITSLGRTLFIAGEAGILLRSEDRGQTWEQVESPYDGSFFGITGTPDGGAVVAFGLRGRAFRSADRGVTWKPLAVPAGAAWMSAALLPNGSLLMVSPGIGGYASPDSGLTFSAVPGFPLGATSAAGASNAKIVAVGSWGAQQVPQK